MRISRYVDEEYNYAYARTVQTKSGSGAPKVKNLEHCVCVVWR